jgi:DNA-binding IscR family transcriptional regulator
MYQVFLDVRDAAARILEHTTLADLIDENKTAPGKRRRKKQEAPKPGQPTLVRNASGSGSKHA